MIDVTWMPYTSVTKSVESLTDPQIESAWIASYHTLRTLLGCRNPIDSFNVRLWRGYEIALANYSCHLLEEMLDRDLQMSHSHVLFWAIIEDAPRIESYEPRFKSRPIDAPTGMLMMSTRRLSELQLLPKWFGWSPLHKSHREVLKSEDISELVWPWSKRALPCESNAKRTRQVVEDTSGKSKWYGNRNDRSRKIVAG